MPGIAPSAHGHGLRKARPAAADQPDGDGLRAAQRDDDMREVLRGPSVADARESLVYWRSRLDRLPRRRRSARREARAMVVAWEERVRNAEIDRLGGGWLGRVAGGVAVLRTLALGAAVRRVLGVLLPSKLVVGVLSVMLAVTLVAGVLLGTLLSALL
jgi:hypothetical protein